MRDDEHNIVAITLCNGTTKMCQIDPFETLGMRNVLTFIFKGL